MSRYRPTNLTASQADRLLQAFDLIAGVQHELTSSQPAAPLATPCEDSAKMSRPDDLLTVREVSDLTGLAVQTLRNLRTGGQGPAGFILRGRLRYRRSDVEQWIREEGKLA